MCGQAPAVCVPGVHVGHLKKTLAAEAAPPVAGGRHPMVYARALCPALATAEAVPLSKRGDFGTAAWVEQANHTGRPARNERAGVQEHAPRLQEHAIAIAIAASAPFPVPQGQLAASHLNTMLRFLASGQLGSGKVLSWKTVEDSSTCR